MPNKGQPPRRSRKGRTCETPRCRRPKACKADGYLLSLCWKCRSRILKQRQPATYFLNTLRRSAKKRGLSFSLTLDEFRLFCASTGFLELKGKQPDSLTIDRIDANDGYHIHNIQVLTHAANSRQGKYNIPRYLREEYARMENAR